MTIQCMYCKRQIGEASEGIGVTHGICTLCALEKAGVALAEASMWLGTAGIRCPDAGAVEARCDQLVRDVSDLETRERGT